MKLKLITIMIALLWRGMADVCYGPETELKDTNDISSRLSKRIFPNDSLKGEEIYMIVDSMPSFLDYDNPFEAKQWIRKKFYELYPMGCEIYTKVFVEFIVEKDGSLSNVRVVKGKYEEINEVAVRLVKLMPKWNPGKQDGKPVRVSFILPITFDFF